MDILFLEPSYQDYMWGGSRLKEEFNKNTPYEITAESWEVSTNGHGKSKIINGEYKGKDLEEIFQNSNIRREIFGCKCIGMQKFPLLIKFIDAKQDLSVQVHPDDNYAKKYENDSGKTEMWYILDCKKDAKLVYGLKNNVKKEDLIKYIKNGIIKPYLNYIDIKKGDIIYVPSGTVHAILADTLICEIQQNCDLTYRIYDWDRVDKDGKPRELHIKKAIDIINFDNKIEKKLSQDIEYQNLVSSRYFSVDKIKVEGEYSSNSNKESFYAINVIEGEGTIKTKEKEYKIYKGNSFIIPALLGEYKIIGKLILLSSYI